MYQLRPYQADAVRCALNQFKYGKPFVIQMATGAGKSLVIADVCHKLDQPVLILQPSKELLEQNHAKLVSYGVSDIAIYSASKKSKEIGKYTYATIGSIFRKPELFKHFRYVIIDECHGLNSKNQDSMYAKFLSAIGCRNVMGLTATPYRIVQKYTTYQSQLYYTASLRVINRIHPFFWKNIAYVIETDQLIKMGYLAPIKYFTDKIELDKLIVNSTGADYTTKSLELWAMTKTERIVESIKFVEGRASRSLTFCTSILQANRVLARLQDDGLRVGLVTGETPKLEREEIVENYRNGQLKHMINVGVFTTGFDVPELDCVILARPTMSLALYYQMVGRGVRIDPANPDKVLRVIDLAGVVERMGRVETIKLGKEDGYKDTVMSEVGRMDEQALFTFKIIRKAKTA